MCSCTCLDAIPDPGNYSELSPSSNCSCERTKTYSSAYSHIIMIKRDEVGNLNPLCSNHLTEASKPQLFPNL
jgi:hypothetical protein